MHAHRSSDHSFWCCQLVDAASPSQWPLKSWRGTLKSQFKEVRNRQCIGAGKGSRGKDFWQVLWCVRRQDSVSASGCCTAARKAEVSQVARTNKHTREAAYQLSDRSVVPAQLGE